MNRVFSDLWGKVKQFNISVIREPEEAQRDIDRGK